MSDTRPNIAYYTIDENGNEVLYQGPMNDDQYAQWQADQQALTDSEIAYQAAPATADDHAAASAALITSGLASVPVPRDQLPAILQTLLGEASAAIPFFEQYAKDPSEASTQWTNFQALDQTTKDRLLYDSLRTLSALLRYLTGNLPTS